MTQSIPEVTDTIIKHGLLIHLTINSNDYYISNLYNPIVWQGNNYTQLGNFLGIGEIQDDLRVTNNQLSLSLSGIPAGDGSPDYMNIILNTPVKGSRIRIYRAFFNLDTYTITNAYLRFNGYISNFSLSENWDQEGKLTSHTISIQCSSIHGIMEKQYSGRRTNDTDQKFWYPGDTGMYRVKEISETNFDFGKPYTAPTTAPAPTDTNTGGGY